MVADARLRSRNVGLKRAGIGITGILGVDDAESRRAAESLGLPKAYRDIDEVLSDKRVGAVHITTPNRLHYAMAKRALEAGKHVLCEKPLAMNSRESAELVALAKKTGLAAGVNYNIRFYPLCLEAREMVRRGDLGEVFSVCGNYVQDWLLLPTDYNWRVLAKEGGELRAVADIGTHWLDLVHAVTGLDVEAVCADLKTVHPTRHRPRGEVQTFKGKEEKVVATEPVPIDTEDFGSVLLRFKGGARGVLWVSQVTAGRKNCLRFDVAGAGACRRGTTQAEDRRGREDHGVRTGGRHAAEDPRAYPSPARGPNRHLARLDSEHRERSTERAAASRLSPGNGAGIFKGRRASAGSAETIKRGGL